MPHSRHPKIIVDTKIGIVSAFRWRIMCCQIAKSKILRRGQYLIFILIWQHNTVWCLSVRMMLASGTGPGVKTANLVFVDACPTNVTQAKSIVQIIIHPVSQGSYNVPVICQMFLSFILVCPVNKSKSKLWKCANPFLTYNQDQLVSGN